MSDPFDDRMRELANAARAETEAALDVDDALDAVYRSSGTAAVVPRRPRHRKTVGWLTAAAALTFALSAGILFTRGADDDVVTMTTDAAAPVTLAPVPTTGSPTVTTTPPATTVPGSSAPVAPPATTPGADPATDVTTVPVTQAPVTTLPPGTTMPTDGDVTVIGWREFPWEASGIAGSCVPGAATCTQLVHDASGDPVTYEPTTRVLTRHVVPPVSVTLPTEYGDTGFVVAAGPDDVVYLSVAPAVAAEMAADVVAVTLTSDDAGREIGRWAGVTNTVGDSSLVATRDGLVNVGCCGPDTVRPAPDAEVLVPWLDSDGEPRVLDAPTFRVEIDYPSLTVQRRNPDGSSRSWTYQPGGDWMPRGMPNLTATFDGGFVAAEFGSGGSSVARGYADGRLDQIVLGPDFTVVDAVDPAGRLLIGDAAGLDDRFARVDPFANGVAEWAGAVSVEPDGSLRFDDTGDISAGSVVEFVDAIAPAADVNEIRTIDTVQRNESAWSATVTTANLFDDSVAATRWELEIGRGDDGAFGVTSGRATQVCQPGRGSDTFTTELCV